MSIYERFAPSLDFFKDIGGFLCPDEGLRVLIVASDVRGDRSDQFVCAAEDTAAYSRICKVTEEPFHHVEPGGAGWGEVHVEAFVACEPALDLGVFVCRIVVGDKMNIEFGRRLLVDQTQKLQPLGVAMPLHASANDRSIERV